MSEEATEIAELYEKVERMTDLIRWLDRIYRIVSGVIYIIMIGEFIGVPLPEMAKYVAQYFKIMPALLEPYRDRILVINLILFCVDSFFGNLLIRIGGENYVRVMPTLMFLTGFLLFCGYPTLPVFIIFVLPHVLALYNIITRREAITKVVKAYVEGSFE